MNYILSVVLQSNIVKGFVKMVTYFMSRSDVTRYKGNHIITYYYNNKQYKILYKHSKGKKIPLKFESEGIDVSDDVAPYIGPFHDCHGMSICPSDLGYNELKVYLLGGDEKFFSKTEIIDI